jgi:hypothetical protein
MSTSTLVGERFTNLVVVSTFRVCNSQGSPVTKCVVLCDCGNTKEVFKYNLTSGHTESCGCLKLLGLNATHGRTRRDTTRDTVWDRTYTSYMKMRERIRYPQFNPHYVGVLICERWGKFENFLEDMGERPEGKSLDRINPYGNYEPSNCRWATDIEQANNRRRRNK